MQKPAFNAGFCIYAGGSIGSKYNRFRRGLVHFAGCGSLVETVEQEGFVS